MSIEGTNMEHEMRNRQLWEEELDASPLLQALKEEEVFDVPADYFTKVGPQFLDKLAEANLLENASTLRQAGKANVFHVPKAYFEELPEKIGRLIHLTPAKVIPFWGRAATRISSIAAAIVLLISVIGVSNQIQTKADPVAQAVALTDGLSEEEIMLVMSLEDASSDDFIELLDQEVGDPSLDMLGTPADEWLEELDTDEIEDLMLYDM